MRSSCHNNLKSDSYKRSIDSRVCGRYRSNVESFLLVFGGCKKYFGKTKRMAGKKKKSLASRLARMSDDERVKYLQRKAEMEDEIRRKREQLISTFMKVPIPCLKAILDNQLFFNHNHILISIPVTPPPPSFGLNQYSF